MTVHMFDWNDAQLQVGNLSWILWIAVNNLGNFAKKWNELDLCTRWHRVVTYSHVYHTYTPRALAGARVSSTRNVHFAQRVLAAIADRCQDVLPNMDCTEWETRTTCLYTVSWTGFDHHKAHERSSNSELMQITACLRNLAVADNALQAPLSNSARVPKTSLHSISNMCNSWPTRSFSCQLVYKL